MKIIFILAFFLSTAWSKSEMFVCSAFFAQTSIKKAKAHSDYDKNNHCSVSCMLTLRCPESDVLLIGAMKEVKDLLGTGTPSIDDLRANLRGIELAASQAARTDRECLSQCDNYFPSK